MTGVIRCSADRIFTGKLEIDGSASSKNVGWLTSEFWHDTCKEMWRPLIAGAWGATLVLNYPALTDGIAGYTKGGIS